MTNKKKLEHVINLYRGKRDEFIRKIGKIDIDVFPEYFIIKHDCNYIVKKIFDMQKILIETTYQKVELSNNTFYLYNQYSENMVSKTILPDGWYFFQYKKEGWDKNNDGFKNYTAFCFDFNQFKSFFEEKDGNLDSIDFDEDSTCSVHFTLKEAKQEVFDVCDAAMNEWNAVKTKATLLTERSVLIRDVFNEEE